MQNRVGIVSCYFHPNYGSMLQAYATQKIIEEMEFSCENICIDGIKKEMEQSKVRFYLKQVGNPQVFTGTILRIGKKVLYKKLLKKTLGKSLQERQTCFTKFIEEHFIISAAAGSKAELTETCKQYDTIVIGSDQLWLPSNIEADYYTLNWVPEEVKKVAYATSFGTSFLPEKLQGKAREFLQRFQCLSVREYAGKEMIQKYAGLEVPVVCDPTILFTGEEWMGIQQEQPLITGDYILCYFLGNNKEDRDFADRLRKETGCKIVALLHLDEFIKADEVYADETPFSVGPGELLNLIRCANYIVTDSFHGSVFSMLYGKIFFTSQRVRKKGLLNTNSRIESLMQLSGITGRLITGDENVRDCLDREIDYKAVHENLARERAAGREYLRLALESD